MSTAIELPGETAQAAVEQSDSLIQPQEVREEFPMPEIPPDKTSVFFDNVAAIVADLRDNGPAADELERVRNPFVSGIENELQTNGAWLGALTRPPDSDLRVGYLHDLAVDMAAVSAASVQEAARQYLVDANAWSLTILPRNHGAAPQASLPPAGAVTQP